MDRDLYTIGAYEDLKAAAKKLVSSGKRQLLVVDEGSVVGVLSSLDILTEFIKQKHIPEKASVSEVMSRDIVYCSPEDSVSSIWDKIAKTGFSGMPVVLGKKVVGMVTRMNLLKHRKAGISSEGGRPKSIPVKKVMSTPVITCAKSSTIPEVAEIMVSKRILRVPVTGPKDELVGIADTEDILRAYLNLR
jgi:CBS domain-containing protein